MRLSKNLTLAAAFVPAAALLVACTTDSVIPDRRPDYRQAQPGAALEVPPDLTASTLDDTLKVPELAPGGRAASLSDYSRERGGATPRVAAGESVLLQPQAMHIEREGDKRWLVVQAPADQVWSKIKDFWTSNGFAIKRDDPRIGILETDWVENRADIPKDAVRALLSKAIDFAYSAPTRDKFRVRLERSADGATSVYLTHYGVEEVVKGAVNSRGDDGQVIWQPRPTDPELEAEMLSRLMVFLGADAERARAEAARGDQAAPAAATVRFVQQNGAPALVIGQDYARSWRLVGLALDGSDFAVEDQDRNQGLYVVEFIDRTREGEQSGGGWFSGWFDSKGAPQASGQRYRVRLADQGAQTLVLVQTAQGASDSSPIARRILDTIAQGVR